jgi:hypothetical protein
VEIIMRLITRIAMAVMVAASAASQALAQDARIANAFVQKRAISGSLEQTVNAIVAAQQDAAWIGYAVPMVAGERNVCCGSSDGCCVSCRLEQTDGSVNFTRGTGAPVKLEAGTRLLVMLRAEQRQMQRLRIFSDDCQIDAGGRTVYWLDGATDADSLAYLAGIVNAGGIGTATDRREEPAISAIALHASPAADAALERFMAPGQPESRRRKAAFWMGNSRGRRGFETLRRMVRDDQSDAFRKSAVFALSQSREPEVVDTLIALGREDRTAVLRGEAHFWLAQKADPKVGPALLQAVATETAPEVRKKAVFALSQMKDDAGVPHLVKLAKEGASADVRGEAIFWLAQKAGRKAGGAIADAIENDPDTEVKKKAVFALSQLPKDEGVPLLIQVAKQNRNPAVRKQAIFWLGQSKDARALAFFEEILK